MMKRRRLGALLAAVLGAALVALICQHLKVSWAWTCLALFLVFMECASWQARSLRGKSLREAHALFYRRAVGRFTGEEVAIEGLGLLGTLSMVFLIAGIVFAFRGY